MENNKKDKRPKIIIGVLLYNGKKHLADTIESLLGQTYNDFKLLIVNDASTDESEEIALKYLKKDNRISYYKNKVRIGMASNYIKAFKLARDVDYFAWSSDHDIYKPFWLERMVNVLNNNPRVILAYPVTVRIGENGEGLGVNPNYFETTEMNVEQRINALFKKNIGFGNMIYGLFRANALRRAKIFRKQLLPDFLLLAQMSLYGEFKQVNEALWYRRYADLFSWERQKKTVLLDNFWYGLIPWPCFHLFYLLWNTVLDPRAGNLKTRKYGLVLSYKYFYHALGKGGHSLKKIRKKIPNPFK